MSTPDAIKKVHEKMELFDKTLSSLEDEIHEEGDVLHRIGAKIEEKVEKLTELREELFDAYQLDDIKWYVETLMTSDDYLPALDDLGNDTPVSSATNRGSNGRAMLGFTSQEMFDVMDALGLPPNTPPSRVKEALLERLKS